MKGSVFLLLLIFMPHSKYDQYICTFYVECGHPRARTLAELPPSDWEILTYQFDQASDFCFLNHYEIRETIAIIPLKQLNP